MKRYKEGRRRGTTFEVKGFEKIGTVLISNLRCKEVNNNIGPDNTETGVIEE